MAVVRFEGFAGQHVPRAGAVGADGHGLGLHGQVGQHAQHPVVFIQAQVRVLRFARGDGVRLPVGMPDGGFRVELVERHRDAI